MTKSIVLVVVKLDAGGVKMLGQRRRNAYGETVRYFVYGNFAEATPIQDREKKASVRLIGFKNAIAKWGYLHAVEAFLDGNDLVRLRRID